MNGAASAQQAVPMSNTAVTAVVVAYRSRDTIGSALTAMRPAADAGLLHAIVVDNASGDGTADLVARDHPWARLIRNPGNVGYGRGCNVGLAAAESRYVLFMNPDAVLPADDLRLLVQFMDEHPNAAMAGPMIENPDGSFQGAGALPTPWSTVAKAMGLWPDVWQRRPIAPGAPPRSTNWLCGALMLARTDFVRQLGGFDPRFFLYYEETDLCRRILGRGGELWAVGEARAHHVGGASTGGTGEQRVGGNIARHLHQSRFHYLVKHFGYGQAVTAQLLVRLWTCLRWLVRRVRGRPTAEITRHLRQPLLSLPPIPQDLTDFERSARIS